MPPFDYITASIPHKHTAISPPTQCSTICTSPLFFRCHPSSSHPISFPLLPYCNTTHELILSLSFHISLQMCTSHPTEYLLPSSSFPLTPLLSTLPATASWPQSPALSHSSPPKSDAPSHLSSTSQRDNPSGTRTPHATEPRHYIR